MASKSAHLLVVSVIFLVALGIVMLFSTSAFSAGHEAGDIYYDVKRQFLWLLLGGTICAVLTAVDYHWLERGSKVWYALALVALIACFLPLIGVNRNGASRWIGAEAVGLASLRFQPSEFAKIAVIAFLATWYAGRQEVAATFREGFLKPLTWLMVPVLLIAVEWDLGSAALLVGTGLVVLFVSGVRMLYVGASGMAVLGGLGLAILFIPNRLNRFLAFLNLEAYKDNFGLQQWRALLAFGSGGMDGLGLGNGRQKMLYLPYAHTDFIFPMIGEELGLVFTLLVVLFFVVILVSGSTIALHAPDRFGKLLATGLVTMIILQALINIGVTTAVLPNKGLPLPFVSYGGSNLLCCLAATGVLLNIYRQGTHLRDDRFPKILRAKVTPRL